MTRLTVMEAIKKSEELLDYAQSQEPRPAQKDGSVPREVAIAVIAGVLVASQNAAPHKEGES
jgi:hypothetical protein